MKTKNLKIALFVAITSASLLAGAQSSSLPVMAFIDVDSRNSRVNTAVNPVSAITRVELEKLKKYHLLDKYDLEYLTKRDSIQISNCYSRLCLSETGKKLHVDKIFTGSVEEMADQIIITFKIFDVSSEQFEKVQVNEFLNIPTEIKNMIRVTINDMFGVSNEADLVSKLTRKDDYDNAVNNPYEIRLRCDGPRMGFTMFSGNTAAVLKKPASLGGYDAHPLMFQFGYQFERQYLNEGNFQALFEFIPMLTGLDQGMMIPSFTFMNGLRSNKSGLEFAFGPTASLVNKANGILDSRGDAEFSTGFVFAFGKTFKSGKLNIPINGYIIPNKNGARFGFSFGFNARERYNLTTK